MFGFLKPKEKIVYVPAEAKYKVGDFVYAYYRGTLSQKLDIVSFTISDIEIKVNENGYWVTYGMHFKESEKLRLSCTYRFEEKYVSSDLTEIKMRVANSLIGG